MIKAVGGEELSVDGQSFWAIFSDDFRPALFDGRVVQGREIVAEASDEDVEDVKRGSIVERGSSRYRVENVEPFDSGMKRLVLVAMQ